MTPSPTPSTSALPKDRALVTDPQRRRCARPSASSNLPATCRRLPQRSSGRDPARANAQRCQGRDDARVRRRRRRRARRDDGDRGRRRRRERDDHGDHGRRAVRRLATSPAAWPGRSRIRAEPVPARHRTSRGHPGRARLDAVAATSDGFELSELDLTLRREGTILGGQQHGRSDLKLLSLVRDRDLIGDGARTGDPHRRRRSRTARPPAAGRRGQAAGRHRGRRVPREGLGRAMMTRMVEPVTWSESSPVSTPRATRGSAPSMRPARRIRCRSGRHRSTRCCTSSASAGRSSFATSPPIPAWS